MATYNYYAFTHGASYYAGTYATPVNVLNIPEGSLCKPSSVIVSSAIINDYGILKFSPGNVYGTNESVTYALDYMLTIESMTISDWSLNMKNKWFQSYMTKVGLARFINETIYTKLFNDWEAAFGFEQLSGLSLAYVNQDASSLEIRIGVNVYENTFFKDWVFTYSQDPNLGTVASDIYGTLIPGPHYISNVGKVTYGGHTDIVWSFAKANIFTEYVLAGGESLITGGGNMFAEIKLAGGIFNNGTSNIKPHYIVVKNVPKDDPSKGLCTYYRAINNDPEFDEIHERYLAPFCIGDVLTVINNSIYTTRTNLTSSFTWTWFGDIIDVPTIWYLADVTNPCEDYRTVPIYDMLFPLRVISECKYENFD